MVFDLSKYADDIVNAEYDRIDRDWIEEGTHIIKIEACTALTGQNTGRDMVILEGEITSTDSNQQSAGTKVKHIWSLSGVEKWKVQRNLGQIKSMVKSTLWTSLNKRSMGEETLLFVGLISKSLQNRKPRKTRKRFSVSVL